MRRAGLTAVEHASADAAFDGGFQIGIGQDHARRFTAQLQSHALDALCSQLAHTFASAGRAREADHVHFRMAGQHFTHFRAGAVDQVENPRWQTCFVDDFSQDHGVDGRDFAGLEHHGATRCHGKSHFERDLVEREIPRRDAAHHANGFAHHQ